MSGFFSSLSLRSPLVSSFLNGLLGCFSSASKLHPSRNRSSLCMGTAFVCFAWSSICDLFCSSTCVCWIRKTTITTTATMMRAITTPIVTLSIGVRLSCCRGRSAKCPIEELRIRSDRYRIVRLVSISVIILTNRIIELSCRLEMISSYNSFKQLSIAQIRHKWCSLQWKSF